MSKISAFILFFFVATCFGKLIAQEKSALKKVSNEYISVGEEVDVQNLLSVHQMQEKYETLKPGDTVKVSFEGKVTEVCKNKGCWMKMALQDGQEVMVKFKDYAFFVPRDIATGTAIINGKAYVEEMSVEEQRHYAEDAGRSPKEVTAITNPKKTFLFIAEGVKIKREH